MTKVERQILQKILMKCIEYFPGSQQEKWLDDYKKRIESHIFYHDEPLVTLFSLYLLFREQAEDELQNGKDKLNHLLRTVFTQRHDVDFPQLKTIEKVRLETALPENLTYREALRNSILANTEKIFHPYHDRHTRLATKLQGATASLEGNTHLDLLITGKDSQDQTHLIFTEAKFLSDISYSITYSPTRNQIARNLDIAIELILGKTRYNVDFNIPNSIDHFWFILLTPRIFRTKTFGANGNTRNLLEKPDRSRLYCYKMDDYAEPEKLKADLEHWQPILKPTDWETLSNHIGWLSFEEIVEQGGDSLVSSPELKNFFKQRGFIT